MKFDSLTALHRMVVDFRRLGLDPPQRMVFDADTFDSLASELVASTHWERGSDPCTAVTDGMRIVSFRALGVQISRDPSSYVFNAAEGDRK